MGLQDTLHALADPGRRKILELLKKGRLPAGEIAAQLPYVRTLHNFRLLNENAMLRRAGIEDNQIGGITEVYFGLFTDPEDGCQPRARALAIQECTGSKADLYSIGKQLTNKSA